MTIADLRDVIYAGRCVYVVRDGEVTPTTADEYARLTMDQIAHSLVRLCAGEAERIAHWQRMQIEARS